MNRLLLLLSAVMFSTLSYSQGYKIGDEAANFNLKNIDGELVSLTDYTNDKGVVVIFTCNHCPYSVAYEDRIIAIDKEFKEKGFPVVAINPNDPSIYPSDSFDEMKVRAEEKGFTFPYLFDEKQDVFPKYGATKTPHVYLLENKGGKFIVAYIGAIDDNNQDEKAVKDAYLKNAITSLIDGKKPNPSETKAIGCSIKVKK